MKYSRKDIILFLATGFGISRYAPQPGKGTAGSLVALLLFLLIPSASGRTYWTFLILFTVLAVYVAGEAEKILNEKDSPLIVIDEFVGVFVSLTFLPKRFGILLFGFVL